MPEFDRSGPDGPISLYPDRPGGDLPVPALTQDGLCPARTDMRAPTAAAPIAGRAPA